MLGHDSGKWHRCPILQIRDAILFLQPQLIRSHNYPVEEHKNIKTEDNYLLDLYRIPDRRGAQNGSSNKPPVLLMHGLFGSSKDFVLMGPSKGLAFLLADRDFDVWLGNARGTTSSRKHLKYNPDVHPEYWHFRCA